MKAKKQASRYAMNKFEHQVKDWIIHDVLLKNGYKVYAKHFVNYDLFLTRDPSVAARVSPYKGIIELNMYFDDPDMISVIIRHELLHEMLQHRKRAIVRVCKILGFDPKRLKKKQYELAKYLAFQREDISILPEYGPGSVQNFAGDWDVSKYYNDKDKELQKGMDFYGSALGGMVLSSDHPEWINLSFEELSDELDKVRIQDRIRGKTIVEGNLQDEETFLPELVEEHSDDLKAVEAEAENKDTFRKEEDDDEL